MQQGVIILFPLFLLGILSRTLDYESFQVYVSSFFVVQFISLLIEHDHNTSGMRLLNLSLNPSAIFTHLLRQKFFWFSVTALCLLTLSATGLTSFEIALAAVLIAIPAAFSPQFFFVYRQQNHLNMAIEIGSRLIVLVFCAVWSNYRLNFTLFDFLAFQFAVTLIFTLGHWYLITIISRDETTPIVENSNKLERSMNKVTRELFHNRLITFLIAFLPFFLFGSSLEWIGSSDTIVSRLYLSILALLFPMIKFLLPKFLKTAAGAPLGINHQALYTTIITLPIITICIVGFLIFSNQILFFLFNVDIHITFEQSVLFLSILPIVVSIIIGTSVKLATSRESEIRNVMIRTAPIMLLGVLAAVLLESVTIIYITVLIFETCVAIQYAADFLGDLRRRNE